MVNLYSDTQTRPTPEMRAAIAAAEVGDEQRGADPTVRALEERVAALLGHEAAVFLPIGHDVQRDRDPAAHPAGRRRDPPRARDPSAALRGRRAGGAVGRRDDGRRRRRRACSRRRRCDAAIREHPAGDRYAPRPRLVCVEQPTNMGGGRVWPLEQVEAVVEVARSHGLRTHLDGARLMNAVVASGVDAAVLGRTVRHRVGRLHEGPRRAGRRVPRGVRRAHRRGVALEADARRRDAPGGDRRRRGPVRAGPPRRPPRRRPRASARAWPTASPGCRGSSSTRRPSRRTSSSSRSRMRPRSATRSRARTCS